MARAQRGGTKLKRKQARASAARLRRGRKELDTTPTVLPVVTAMTPRPNLEVPVVSVENVDWEDGREPLSPLMRWQLSERQLQGRLGEIGVADHAAKFELKEGRVVWLDAVGVAVAEARAQVVASWIRTPAEHGQGLLVMAWADPLLAGGGIARQEEMGDSLPVDLPTARELAHRAAEVSGAEFVKSIETPQGEHFLALRALRPSLGAAPVTPGTPVGMVLRGLADVRRSVAQRDEPTDVLRARFLSLGKTLLVQADGPYKDSEWVGRLQRAGKVLTQLAGRLVPPTFTAIAAGRQADEWLAQSVAVDLADAIKLLEDEWGAFT
ncbi:MAG: hypothetical protein JNL21_26245 [Myxococcales bacterium]|nr:hypothetical protein [Myxococcales bacterium]